MITNTQLTREIELTTESMQTAQPDDRSYLVGKMAALLWVRGGGDLLRLDAQQQASRMWDTARANVS